jgi:hypothetical protein
VNVTEDLITLIDFCDLMATCIRDDYEDPRGECRAIWDAHDMAHARTGGDALRHPWGHFRAHCHEGGESVATDEILRRANDLHARLVRARE